MKLQNVKSARCSRGKTQKQMAEMLKISQDTYSKKERGILKFRDDEKIIIAKEFSLSLEQVNDLFFGSQLPCG